MWNVWNVDVRDLRARLRRFVARAAAAIEVVGADVRQHGVDVMPRLAVRAQRALERRRALPLVERPHVERADQQDAHAALRPWDATSSRDEPVRLSTSRAQRRRRAIERLRVRGAPPHGEVEQQRADDAGEQTDRDRRAEPARASSRRPRPARAAPTTVNACAFIVVATTSYDCASFDAVS